MTIFGLPLLSTVIWLPAAGALLLVFLPRRWGVRLQWIAFAIALADAILSLLLYTRFQLGTARLQFAEDATWIPVIGARYHVGVDGISLFLVLLTTWLSALALLSSWSAITSRIKEYAIAMLLLMTGMIGVFCAVDLLLFYFFWEGMLIPMYLLIGIWGGPRRVYATIKFVLYTMTGSVLMLVAIIALAMFHARATGVTTFDLAALIRTPLSPSTQTLMFAAFAVAFAIKVPMFPFHTWLPDAHVEAPTAGSVILAGVLLKMGTYGFLRFCLPLFPLVALRVVPLVSIVALVGIVYGALVSWMQRDVKKLVAYSSVSHLGFVMLGIFALNMQGITGSLVQMVNHGLSTGALFLLIGMLYERRHTRMLDDFGGLAHTVPVLAAAFLFVTLSSIGLPGLNGFVGEFLILLGAFRAHVWYGTIGATGVVLGAIYMLWMYQRVWFGQVTHAENRTLRDMIPREALVLVPVLAGMVWIGLYSPAMTKRMEPSVEGLIASVRTAQMMAEAERAAPRSTAAVAAPAASPATRTR